MVDDESSESSPNEHQRTHSHCHYFGGVAGSCNSNSVLFSVILKIDLRVLNTI